MNRVTQIANWLSAMALVLLPSLAFASPDAEGGHDAGGHGGHGGLGDLNWLSITPDEQGRVGFVWVLLNFGILILLLNKLVFKPLKAGHHKKHEDIKSELSRATEAREGAEALLSECQGRLDDLVEEKKRILADARKAAEAEKERILADAKTQAEQIRKAAAEQAEREAETLRKDIEAEVVDRAVDAAEKVLRAQFGAADQRKIVADYVGEVGAAQLGEGRA